MRRFAVASLALGLFTIPAAAQNPGCAGAAVATQDACEKAADLFSYMMPQLGTSLVGGSHTLGIGTTLGGFPHFAIALRGNLVKGDLPDLDGLSTSITGRQQSNIGTSSQYLGLPGVDLALGIWKGLPLGVTRVGGIDLLGNVTYVPEIDDSDNGISLIPTSGSTKFGVGVRVGILEQSLIVPGVSFSYMRRDVPTMDLSAEFDNATFSLEDFSVKTTSWRLAAQKNFLIFQLSGGLGQDKYESSTVLSGTVDGAGAPLTGIDLSQDLTRTTYYGSLGFNLFLAKIVAEIGQVSGGTVTTYNTFDEPADKSRLYGTLGIRVSF